MDILVYGAGVVGSQYAARLRQAGHMVTLLARNLRAEEVREHGIVLEAANTGHIDTVHVSVKETLEPDDAYELVIVALRMNQITDALPVLAGNKHTPSILFLGNNPSGANEYIAALGRERVLLGFGAVGGVRRGHIIRYTSRPGLYGRTYLGELDGQASSRLIHIAIALTEARLDPQLVPNMDAWLKTHAAVINPLALALYSAEGDNYRLARTRDGLLLAVRGVRESLRTLRELNIPIIPGYYRLLEWLPEPLLLVLLRGFVNTHAAEINIAGHANAARDEMWAVADEFETLTRATGRLTPALYNLRLWLDPANAPLEEGSAALPVDMRAVWIAAGIAFGLGLTSLLSSKRKK